MSPEELYISLGRLVESQPDINNQIDFLRWLGRATALLELVSANDVSKIRAAITVRISLDPAYVLTLTNAALFNAIAVTELSVPVSAQGSFIQAGNALDAMAAVGKVLQGANAKLRFVDPYMDETTLTDFIPMAKEGVLIELLSDQATVKPSLSAAAKRFAQQFGGKRPIEVRISSPKALHDRLIISDGATVYSVTQSLNKLASRSPASIIRVDGETASLKLAAYEAYWQAATPLA